MGPWLHRRFGPETIARVFGSLPEELRSDLDPSSSSLGALASSWYDARIYHHVFDALLENVPPEEHASLARDAARMVLEHTLRGIYAKLFRLMATPPLYARYVQKIWDMHYDTGEVTIEHLSPSRALHRVQGWTGHHPFACVVNRQSGAIVYAMMGMPHVRIEHEKCAWPICEAVYSWKV